MSITVGGWAKEDNSHTEAATLDHAPVHPSAALRSPSVPLQTNAQGLGALAWGERMRFTSSHPSFSSLALPHSLGPMRYKLTFAVKKGSVTISHSLHHSSTVYPSGSPPLCGKEQLTWSQLDRPSRPCSSASVLYRVSHTIPVSREGRAGKASVHPLF